MIAKRVFPAALAAALLASATVPSVVSAQNYPVERPEGGATGPGPAPAGVEWDKKRLDRLERAVERLENTIARMKPDKAPPNLIEPEPEVIALESRADELAQRVTDMQDTLTKVNGALDTANIEIDRSHKAEADARAGADALQTRVAQLESKLAAMEQAAAAQAAQQQAQTQPTVEGGPAPGDPAGDFKAGMDMILGNDFNGAGRAFTAFVGKYPDDAHAPEAHYWLGEIAFRMDDQKNAVAEYAKAIERWPKGKWAPDAIVKLARGLSNLGDKRQACAALGEFDRRYAKGAPSSVKSNAAAVKSSAKCTA